MTRPNLEAFIRERLQPEDRVVLEATTNTWAVVDAIEPHVAEVVVGNPLRTRAIAEAKVKTDKVDAEVPSPAAGTLLAGSTVTVEPGVYLPDHGGVRIEDTLVVCDRAPDLLTRFPKELTIV